MTNEELDKFLCEKYPKMFKDRRGDMSQTCMVWGFECGPGWGNILKTLCAHIQWHIDQSAKDAKWDRAYNKMVKAAKAGDWTLFDKRHPGFMGAYLAEAKANILKAPVRPVRKPVTQVVVAQVKEKFGTLRFYYSGGDDKIQGMVALAEGMSAVTCEECGAPGHSRGGGWVVTLCDEHAKERGIVLTEEEEAAI